MKEQVVKWFKEEMQRQGGTKAVIGMSGGKDSTICAAIAVEALGAENVIGVTMPDDNFIIPRKGSDMEIAIRVMVKLNLKMGVTHIDKITEAMNQAIDDCVIDMDEFDIENEERWDYDHWDKILNSRQKKTNIPPRVRTAVLYGIAACYPGARVINTSNLSEIMVGYFTKWGDSCGDIGPLRNLTKTEVVKLGLEFKNLDREWIIKPPADGLTGKTDEEMLGFSYEEIDMFIKGDPNLNDDKSQAICDLITYSKHKRNPIPAFEKE